MDPQQQLKAEGEVERHRDRFAQAAGEWRDMTFGERIPYEDMARADKDRHQKDVDIASRNLDAALLGSVPKHGKCIMHICLPHFFCTVKATVRVFDVGCGGTIICDTLSLEPIFAIEVAFHAVYTINTFILNTTPRRCQN